MIKKKIIASVIAFAVVVALTVSLLLLGKATVNGTENYSETFTGSISANIYEDKESAARAFVAEELSGASAAPEYVDYTVTGSLTEYELSEINFGRLIDNNIQSGEKVTIRYRNSSDKNEVKAYLLETDNKCCYYVLPPEENEPVTNSYLNSVLDGANYLNCTSTTAVDFSVFDIMTTYVQIIKFDDDKAYFKQEIPGLINHAYLEMYEGGITAYIEHPEKHDGKFYSLSEIQSYYAAQGYYYELYLKKGGEKVLIDSLNSMQDVTDFCFMLDIDASYFVKTKTGFKMTDDKYKAVCKMLAGDALGEELDKFWNEYKVHFKSEYFVTDGRLSSCSLTLKLVYDGNLLKMNINSRYTDFGQTKVEMPDR